MNRSEHIPVYTVRESKKATRVTLRMSSGGTLEVVIPMGFARGKIPQILHEKEEWIQKVLRRLETQEGRIEVSSPSLPESIDLKAVNAHFSVRYEPSKTNRFELMQRDDSCLVLSGDITNVDACRQLLKLWLQHQGRLHLIPWLDAVSIQTGFKYRKAQVRGQRSRWGSCSSQGTISLNHKLLFLSPTLVHYIMIHELCHLEHVNHSAAFWSLVARVEPRYKILDARMKRAAEDVPAWTQ